jgi:hypothetical protein
MILGWSVGERFVDFSHNPLVDRRRAGYRTKTSRRQIVANRSNN